jgi:hypothetical protein
MEFRPEELHLVVPSIVCRNIYRFVDLPCFNRATSISLSIGNRKYSVQLRMPPAGGGECLFPVLTMLVLSGYYTGEGDIVVFNYWYNLVSCLNLCRSQRFEIMHHFLKKIMAHHFM